MRIVQGSGSSTEGSSRSVPTSEKAKGRSHPLALPCLFPYRTGALISVSTMAFPFPIPSSAPWVVGTTIALVLHLVLFIVEVGSISL